MRRTGSKASRHASGTILLAALLAAGLGAGTARAQGYRSIDGTGNQAGDLGAAGTPLLRDASVGYADGVWVPDDSGRAGAREVSNAVSAQSGSMPSSHGLSDYFWLWGQFLDHDIDLSSTQSGPGAESYPIPVPPGDAWFDPTWTGTEAIPFVRSEYDPASGDSAESPRVPMNEITSFIDASNVYGSDPVRAAALRTFEGGRLATSDGDLLPFNTAGLPNANEGPTPGGEMFLAGDVRANENAALTAMHTLWVREHNRLADQIAAASPGLDDEEIYQQARRLVGAQIQGITYREFLPLLVGDGALPAYAGAQQPGVDPRISVVFSTAAYRFGHSMVSPVLLRVDRDGAEIPEGHLDLAQAFFAPDRLAEGGGLDPLLYGLALQPAQEIDTRVVDVLRNFLFGPPGAGGFDLAALNIQRGRDHGVPGYNQLRIDFGLDPVASFDEITSDLLLASALASVYDDVDAIDAWVGGLAEDPEGGALVGELLGAVFTDQFERLRDGDAFWYQASLTPEELALVESTTLGDVISRNSGLDWLAGADVFHVVPEPAGAALLALGLGSLAASRRRRA